MACQTDRGGLLDDLNVEGFKTHFHGHSLLTYNYDMLL